MNKPLIKYKFAVIATDIVIFTLHQGQLKVLLINMKKSPFKGMWAVPGGLIKAHESVDDATVRILKSKSGIGHVYMEQIYTFGRVDRDPFGRVVSVAYMALVPNPLIHTATTSEYADIRWFDVKHLPKLAYDHHEVIKTAIERLKSKLAYTNIVYALLPDEFTLGEIQNTYELILAHKLDRRNFRKKIRVLRLLKRLNKKRHSGASRPADLYSFASKKPQLADIL